jgi:hypothetical protein
MNYRNLLGDSFEAVAIGRSGADQLRPGSSSAPLLWQIHLAQEGFVAGIVSDAAQRAFNCSLW